MAIQKKIILDENSGQPRQKIKQKYVKLNNGVQEFVGKYKFYTDKLKFLGGMVMLQWTN